MTNKSKDVVQIKNPMSGRYIKIDRVAGRNCGAQALRGAPTRVSRWRRGKIWFR